MNEVAVLRRARVWIRQPERWCQGRLDDGGRLCMVGAVMAVGKVHPWADWSGAVGLLDRLVPEPRQPYMSEKLGSRAATWNDEVTHGEVLRLLGRAIAIAEARAAEWEPAEERVAHAVC